MPDYIEYLHLPAAFLAGLAGFLLVLQVVGKILEVKGKVVPEIMTIAKWHKRRKKEKRRMREALEIMPDVKKSLDEFNAHYGSDNITMRNNWMHDVDAKRERDHAWIEKLDGKMDDIKAELLSIRIENMRGELISFASYVADGKNPVTREQFNRAFKQHGDYEKILKKCNKTNGETNTAMNIIRESYEEHMKAHTFIEDVRGYNP